jgi:hypothetical protein
MAIFVIIPIAIREFGAAGGVSNPTIDICFGQIRMIAKVSRVNETDFHFLFGGNGPERADIYPVDAPRCELLPLRLNATAVIQNRWTCLMRGVVEGFIVSVGEVYNEKARD